MAIYDMSLIQQFEPMPDFEPKLSKSTLDTCKTSHDLMVSEQLDLRRQENKWMSDRMVEFSGALKTEWELSTHMRNEVHSMKQDVELLRKEIINKEMTMLKSETYKEKSKGWAIVVGLILTMMALYDVVKSTVSNWQSTKPPTTQTK